MIGSLHARHRAIEFKKFLQSIDREVPAELDVHVILDNSSTTSKKLRRGTHRSVRELNTDIRAWITDWNNNPHPYVWTKTAEQILDSISRYCDRMNASGH